MSKPAVHIVGAGLAGLAAALRLTQAGRHIVLHEAAGQAGGRCRSYFDSTLEMTIDNGNHLLLSGNWAAQSFLKTIGSEDQLAGPCEAEFDFADLATGERWRLRPNGSAIPWWIFSGARRVPGTRARDYLGVLRLLVAARDVPVEGLMRPQGRLYERLWKPFFLAALNTAPSEGSARLAAAIVRETLAKGGNACRPLIAANGLSAAFINPCLAYLKKSGALVQFDHRLRAIEFARGRAEALDFGAERVELAPVDGAILAVPPYAAQGLVPGLQTPQTYRAIINAHFKIAPPPGTPAICGVINGTIEWLFAFEDRLSVTISAGDRLLDVAREELAERIWAEVAKVTRLEGPLPRWQIIKEKRATFAATPEENTRRPLPRTAYSNLLLAGDWTATGLPATIEGAIRSGYRAADLCLTASS